MMSARPVSIGLMTLCWALLHMASPAGGSLKYKSYVVKHDGDREILCDPYVVQKNDYVLKLFRQRGKISEEDFPEFLRIFRRINPHIGNIDMVRPGEQIFIPLKKLKPQDGLPGQASGMVTLPLVTISTLPETLIPHTREHTIQKGDMVSALVAREFGSFGSASYREGIRLFELLNPQIPDPNTVHPGQVILLPLASLLEQPGYASLIETSADTVRHPAPERTLAKKADPVETVSTGKDTPEPVQRKPSAAGDRFLQGGQYFFPRRGKEDMKLDLAKYPVLSLPDGTRMLFALAEPLPEAHLRVIRSFWKKIQVVSVPREPSLDEVIHSVLESVEIHLSENRLSFSDRGVAVAVGAKWIVKRPTADGHHPAYVCITLVDDPSRCTPETVAGYLEKRGITIKDISKKHNPHGPQPEGKSAGEGLRAAGRIRSRDLRGFVRELLEAAGCRYSPNVPVAFSYGGVRITATSNRVTVAGRGEYLVDFGDLYGDAVSAIENTGMEVAQLGKEKDFYRITEKLFNLLGLEHVSDPTFLAADRPAEHNTALTFSGFLITGPENAKTLFAFSPIGDELVRFLRGKGVRAVVVESETGSRRPERKTF